MKCKYSLNITLDQKHLQIKIFFPDLLGQKDTKESKESNQLFLWLKINILGILQILVLSSN